jgi:hypothetical protein
MATSVSAVKYIVDIIESNSHINNQYLVEKFKEAGIIAEDFRAYQDHRHDAAHSYGRKVIYEGRNFIMYIMSWAPGDFTAIHSHGYSEWGSVVFLTDMNHRLYHAEGKTVKLVGKSVVPLGTVVPVIGGLVHAMGNLTNTPSMTLHVYGSGKPTSNANDNSLVYEIDKKQIRTTNGAAYINIGEEFCKKTEPGLLTDTETLLDYLQIVLPFYKKINHISMVQKIEGYLSNPQTYFN